MKRAYYTLVMAIIFASSSCQKNDDGALPVESDKEIDVRTSIVKGNTMSNTIRKPQLNDDGSGHFSEGDIITLHVVSKSGVATTVDYGVGVSKLYWNDVSLNPDDYSVDFSACYPEQNLIDGKFLFDLETTSKKDLLWAHRKGVPIGTETSVDMMFSHVMHHLVINFTTQSDIDVNQIQTVCTAKSTSEIDLVAGTLDNNNSRKADFTETGKKATFTIIPQDVSDVVLHITVGQMQKVFSLDELVTKFDKLESGMQLTVNLMVKDGSIVLHGSSIVPWGDQGTVEGEIVM